MRRVLGAVVLALAVAGCSSTSKVTGTGTNNGTNNGTGSTPVTLSNGTMSATINDTSWVANYAIQAVDSAGRVAVLGMSVNADSTQATGAGFIVEASAPGTYAIDASAPNNRALVLQASRADSTSYTWAATSGSVVISTLTATGASGTFTFVATPESSGATGTETVTKGKFNVKF